MTDLTVTTDNPLAVILSDPICADCGHSVDQYGLPPIDGFGLCEKCLDDQCTILNRAL